VIHDRIQSKSNLEVKKIVDDAGCEVCNDGEETAQHILFDCPFTCSFWAAWAFVRQQDSVPSNCTSCLALTAVTGCRLNTTTAWSSSVAGKSLFGWLVADGLCWFVLREEYCWLVAAGCW
jgi:hypothetical protein